MFTFERTDDYGLVRDIITHPSLWSLLGDDGTPPAEEWEPVAHDGFWYVLVQQRGRLLGLFLFTPLNSICYEVHTCLLPCAWGPVAAAAAKGVASWMFSHSPARRIVTTVPAFNRLALGFAKRAGMQEFGINPQAYLKAGKLHDLILLGLSKE